MKNTQVHKFHLAGYRVRFGSDGYDHLIPHHWFYRGAKAICGHTASKRDYGETKPPCPECMKMVLTQRDDNWFIVPSVDKFPDWRREA